jgi:hypothetical protein
VIRHKIADMVRNVEACQAYVELLAYQMGDRLFVADARLGGALAL